MQDRFKDMDRVTQVLSPFSGYGSIPPDILSRAANRGDLVHKAIKEEIVGMTDWQELPENYQGYLNSFKVFWKERSELVPFACETRYGHEKLNYTGQVDFISISQDGFHIFDWKTSSKPNSSWRYQGSAYIEMLRSEGLNAASCTFVHLDKKGGMPKLYKYTENHEEDFGIFKDMLKLYRLFFKNQTQAAVED